MLFKPMFSGMGMNLLKENFISRIIMIWSNSLSWCIKLAYMFISELVLMSVLNGTLGDSLFGSNMYPESLLERTMDLSRRQCKNSQL